MFKFFKKKEKNKEPTESRFIKRMAGQDYIDSSRAYLDYLEEHLSFVSEAFSELTEACEGKEHWVGDDCEWHSLHHEIVNHDLSKFSKEEFTQYRDKFYPVGDGSADDEFKRAFDNHKLLNRHHHETAKGYIDLVHMLVDWIAMSYKFNSDPREFYEKTKHEMGKNITPEMHSFIQMQLRHLYDHRAKNRLFSN